MQWGAAQKYWQKFIDEGKKLPQQYYDMPTQPDIAEHLITIWNEFDELATERSIGFAEGPIPASKIRERASAIGIDDEDTAERFFKLIRRMDNAYLAERAPKPDNKTVKPDDPASASKLFDGIAERKKFSRSKKKP